MVRSFHAFNFPSDPHDLNLQSRSLLQPTKTSGLARRVVLAGAVGTLAIASGCGNNSNSSSGSSGSGGPGLASSTEPASVAVAASQSVPNARMLAVLDQLAALSAKPIETLTVGQARTQPAPGDAVKALLIKEVKSTAPEAVGSVMETSFASPAGPFPVTG